ncbi:MAG: molybdopterin-dependent oxidoreductase [Candidatus Bathyarchaeia archaeon]|jgi:DMSO/TMAO reductase YedYZ molybdopterin-dependent catalytic subunit
MKLNRRSFIKLVPALALAIAAGSWWLLGRSATEPNITSQPTQDSTHTEQAVTPEVSDFPVTWNGDLPTKIDLDSYRLSVDGGVSKPLELTVDDLYAMSDVQKILKIECVEGWAADVLWEGIPILNLLNRAGVPPKNIAHVTMQSITGYNTTLSSDEVANPANMIALKAGGVPLTVEHGFPARLVAPARLGLEWIKYVSRITCTSK